MQRTKGTYFRPIQGMSQQPPKVRLDGQCELSINFKPDVVQGLITRPCTEYLSDYTLTGVAKDITKVHFYARGDEEEYYLMFNRDGSVYAVSPDGTQHTVSQTSATRSYLSSLHPKDELRCVTIGDYTFVSNTGVVISESSKRSSALVNRAVIYVQFMDYSQTQNVWVNGALVAQYISPDGSSTSHKADVDTEKVASEIQSKMSYWLDSSQWTVTRDASCVFVTRVDGADFTITSSDSAGGDNLKVIKGFVTGLSSLPPRAPLGMMVEVRPSGSTDDSNSRFWLRADKSDRSDNVIWNESLAPDLPVGFNHATMPHVIVREGVGSNGVATFTVRQGEWQDRDVGNDSNNPLPSFVDGTIENIGIFQNRLYVTSGEAVVMTRTSNFFNFYRSTTQAVLDSDPLDVYADSQRVNVLSASSALDGDLIFFSDNGQFRLSGRSPVTPSSVVLTQETQFQANTSVAPVASGEALYFAFDYGSFSGIREFYTDSNTDTKRARPITEHVSRLIVGDIDTMTSSTTVNTLAVLSKNERDRLYIYDWLWDGNEKVQSAWGIWEFDYDILHVEFNRQYLYLLLIDSERVIRSRYIDMGDPDSYGLPFPVRLDDRVKCTAKYSASKGAWVINGAPSGYYNLSGVMSEGAYTSDIGLNFDIDILGNELVTYDELSDNIDGNEVVVYVGNRYKCTYIPTQPRAYDYQGNPRNMSNLSLGVVRINYEDSGSVSVRVADRFGREVDYEFNTRRIDSRNNVVGFTGVSTGAFDVPVRAIADDVTLTITTDSHRPFQMREMEFTGFLLNRKSWG